MSYQVVETFLEDQKHLAAEISVQAQFALESRRVKRKLNPGSRQDFAGKAAHAPQQMREAILMRIGRPNDVAERAHRLARDMCQRLERVRQLGIGVPGLMMQHLAQNGELRQVRADVIVQICGDAIPQALERGALCGASGKQGRENDDQTENGCRQELGKHWNFEGHGELFL